MSRKKGPKPKNQYIPDGARPHKDESKTIPPYAFKVFVDGKEKKGKSVEKVFIGKDSLDDLSSRIIKAIGSPIRLKILLYLDAQSNKPAQAREITDEPAIFRHLKNKYNIINTGLRQNHLKLLIDAGLISKNKVKKEGKEVVVYKTVPGAMESLILTLSNIDQEVKKSLDKQAQLKTDYPLIKILGGPQDTEKYEIHQNPTLLGRVGTLEDDSQFRDDIKLSNYYQSVTRITNPQNPSKAPHAKLINIENEWYIEDCGNNVCGTYINEKKIKKSKLKDYDIIGLARGKYGVDLLFRHPPKKLAVEENKLGDLAQKLTEKEQEELANKIQIIISKLDTQFFMETLDKIIEKIQYLQEIETIIPTLKPGEEINIETHDKKEKELAQKIRKNIEEKEDMDFGDSVENRIYSDFKGKQK